MRRSLLLVGFLCAAALGLTACGGIDGNDGNDGNGDGALGSSAGAAADCIGGLVVDGVWYQPDWNSPAPEEGELGEVIGTVDGQWDCYIAAEELGDGVFATGIADGSEVRRIGMRRVDQALATVSRDGVAVFRSPDSLSLTGALGDEITAIGINSEFDGTTRFATIDDPEVIERLVDAAAAVDQETSLDGLAEGTRYFIEFVHADGLSTSFPYGVERSQLSDRVVGDVWAEAIDTAMAESGEAPTVENLTVSAAGVDAPTHPLGSCRLDRADLTAKPGEIVTVGGEAVADDAIEPWWWINPPSGSAGDLVPAASQTGQGLLVPNVDGAMIVEIYLRTDATADVPLVEACFTLATTGASALAEGAVPSDSLDCTSQSGEPSVEQYDDGGTFPSIAEALTDWFTRAAGERRDIAELQLVATPYDPIANLVNAEGRSQAVIKLTSDGDTSWRVSEAIICPKP